VFSNSTIWTNITSISGIFSNTSNWINITSISGIFTNTTTDIWNNITSISGIFSNTSNWLNITSISGTFSNTSEWQNITSISGIFTNTSDYYNITSISGIFTNTTLFNNISSISGIFSNTTLWSNVTSISGVFVNDSLTWNNVTSISGIFENESIDIDTSFSVSLSDTPTLFFNSTSASNYNVNASQQSDGVYALEITNTGSDNIDVTIELNRTIGSNIHLKWNYSYNPSTYIVHVTDDDIVYLALYNGGALEQIVCLNATTGDEYWDWGDGLISSDYFITPRYYNGSIYVANSNNFNNHKLWRLNASTDTMSDSTRKMATFSFLGDKDVYSSFAISNDYLYMAEKITKTVYCFYANNLTFIWSKTLPASLWGQLAIADGILLVPCDDWNLYALGDTDELNNSIVTYNYTNWIMDGRNNSRHGETSSDYYPINKSVIWTANVTGAYDIWQGPSAYNGIVYMTGKQAPGYQGHLNLSAIYLNNGTIKWTFPIGNSDATPTYCPDDDVIFVQEYRSADDKFWCIYPNGTEKWSVSTEVHNDDPSPGQSAQYDIERNLVFTQCDGFVYGIFMNNGTIKWSYDIASSGTGGDGQAVSGCTVVDGYVYVNSVDNGTFRLDADDGSLSWRKAYNDIWDSSPMVFDGDTEYYTSNEVKTDEILIANELAEDATVSIYLWADFDGVPEYIEIDRYLNITSYPGYGFSGTNTHQDIPLTFRYYEYISTWQNLTSISGIFSNTSNWQNITSISGMFTNITIDVWQNLTSISGVFTNTTTAVWNNITSISGIFSNTSNWINTTSISGIFQNTTVATWQNITSISGIFQNTTNYQNISSISGVFLNTSSWNNITSISGIFTNVSLWSNISSISGIFTNTTTDIWNNISSISGYFSNTSSYHNISSISGIFQNTTLWSNISSISGIFTNTSNWNNITSISGIFTNITVDTWQNITSISGVFQNTTTYNNISSISGVFQNTTIWDNLSSISGLFQNTSNWNNLTSISGVFSNTTVAVWQNLTSISGTFTNTSSWYNITSISGIFTNVTVDTWQNITSISGIFTNTTTPWNNITSISGIFTNTTTPWNNITSISGIFTNTTLIWIILTNEYPSNTSVNIPLQPIIYVTLNSTTGQTMNITWYYGLTQGSETIPLGTDTLFTNSTQTELFHIANTRSTWYYWRIQVDDGTHHINDSFYFRTEGYPGGGGYVMPTGGTIGYIGIFGLVGFIIILIYLFKRKKENNDEEEYH